MKLFDIDNDRVLVNENVLLIPLFKSIYDKYGIKGLSFINFMSNPDSPYSNFELGVKEKVIKEDLELEFTDCPLIYDGIKKVEEMYSTPINRFYIGQQIMMDRISEYLRTTQLDDSRDGNYNEILKTFEKAEKIRVAFENTKKARDKELKTRGNSRKAYDQ